MTNDKATDPMLGVKAWLRTRRERLAHRLHAARQRQLLGRLHHSDVLLEIAPGAGSNFHYYPPATVVYAVEPDPVMHPRMHAAARRRALHLRLLPSRPESLPLADDSVDVAVASLALRAVDDRKAVLAEIRRVLKPGGRFVFVERGHAPGVLRSARNRLAGSRRQTPERSTEELVRESGFSRTELQQLALRTWGLLRWRGIAGYAVK